MQLLYFILCAYGLTQVLVNGTIFDKIRPKHHFFHCPMCMGFWVGVFLWSINGFTELFSFDYNLVNPLILGLLSSGTSYFINSIVGDFGFRGEKLNNMFYRNMPQMPAPGMNQYGRPVVPPRGTPVENSSRRGK